MMNITFYGAAGGVTGASYLCESPGSRILVDCGMFQGAAKYEQLNRTPPPVNYRSLDAILLTHAHLDHCGRLPLAVKEGYHGPVYATPATADLVALILRDALKVQNSDLEKLNRRLGRLGKPPVKPAWTEADVEEAISLLQPAGYHHPFRVVDGMQVTIGEAGHILGSGSLSLEVRSHRKKKTIVFSGDLGGRGLPIVRDAEPFSAADAVIMESTYGDRDHKPLQATIEEAVGVIRDAIAARGKILIPSFAIGRTQDIVYYLEQAFRQGALPRIPVYIDSPMAIEATRIYRNHPELFDEEMLELLTSGDEALDRKYFRPTSTAEESRRLNDLEGPCIIIAGSGMCTAGRILHHFRHNLWKPSTSVLIVGYQAEGTLGRQLVDGARSVRIFGERIAVRASVHKLGGFSAHAGQSELLHWFNAIAPARPKVILVHGEDHAREALAQVIRHRYGLTPLLPGYGQNVCV